MPLRSRPFRAGACELITRSPFITHEKVSGALWTQGLCSSQGRQDFFSPCHYLGCKDAKEIRICFWEEPLSLRSELPQASENAFRTSCKGSGLLAAFEKHPEGQQSLQPSCVESRQFSPSWHPCAGFERTCSSLFSNRKREREEVTREDRASISPQHRVALLAMARGQRSICQSNPVSSE